MSIKKFTKNYTKEWLSLYNYIIFSWSQLANCKCHYYYWMIPRMRIIDKVTKMPQMGGIAPTAEDGLEDVPAEEEELSAATDFIVCWIVVLVVATVVAAVVPCTGGCGTVSK